MTETGKARMRLHIDIDQVLIFFLLAVTIRQMGAYLAAFQVGWSGWAVIGYLQATAIDLAIWRSSWWYRTYRGKVQRRWALTGVVAFSLVSAGYNFGYYTMVAPSLPLMQRVAMAVVLPAGVALLSYLYGQKSQSAFAETKPELAASEAPAKRSRYKCEVCGRSFAKQNALNAHQRTHRANSENGGD